MLALGLLVAVGAAYGGSPDGSPYVDPSFSYYHGFGGYYDWLSPGGYYYGYYPSYSSYYYPTYSYPTYAPVYTPPVYTPPLYTPPVYTTPVVYGYDPVVYDPWWAVNVYGLGATTYYYSSSWSWSSYHGGLYFR